MNWFFAASIRRLASADFPKLADRPSVRIAQAIFPVTRATAVVGECHDQDFIRQHA